MTLPATLPVWFGPAFATTLFGTWVTVVVAGSDVLPFVPVPVIGLWVSTTVSENVYAVAVVPPAPRVKLGVAVLAPVRVTDGPPVCVHAYEIACPPPCADAAPFSVTRPPALDAF